MLESRFWRASFEQRRCLIPGTSFCEAKGKKPATYYWFAMAGEGRPPFAFAGLWRTFKGNYRGELVELDTYTMMTTTANEVVRPIHPDRMPVILDPADYDAWLTGTTDDAFALLRPFPPSRMRIAKSGQDEKSVHTGSNPVRASTARCCGTHPFLTLSSDHRGHRGRAARRAQHATPRRRDMQKRYDFSVLGVMVVDDNHYMLRIIKAILNAVHRTFVRLIERPRHFVQTPTYFDPNRRFRQRPFAGEDRRKNPDPADAGQYRLIAGARGL